MNNHLLSLGLACDYLEASNLVSKMTERELERESILSLSPIGFMSLKAQYENERAEREAEIRSRN